MSDVQHGEGWWRGDDGKWYPPQPLPPPPRKPATTTSPSKPSHKGGRRAKDPKDKWVLLGAVAFFVIFGVAIVVKGPELSQNPQSPNPPPSARSSEEERTAADESRDAAQDQQARSAACAQYFRIEGQLKEYAGRNGVLTAGPEVLDSQLRLEVVDLYDLTYPVGRGMRDPAEEILSAFTIFDPPTGEVEDTADRLDMQVELELALEDFDFLCIGF